MTDVLASLPRLSVGDIVLPLLSRRAGYATENAKHKFQFRDNEIVDLLGSRNWMFEYTIPFREDIAKGPYQNLFTRVLPRFITLCQESAHTPVRVFDPVLGPYMCTCVSFSESTDNNKRDGTEVQVQFLWTPEENEETVPLLQIGSVQGAKSEAGALDKEVAKIDFKQKEPPPPLVNPLSAISGLLKQVQLRGQQAQASLADFASRIQETEDAIHDLENPDLSPTIRSLRSLRDNAEVMKARALNPVGQIRKFVSPVTTTVGELAKQLGKTPAELMEDNPVLAKTAPRVPSGLVIRYRYTTSG